jgi:predicted TIM-barrel fold metal-dependent hydrolase
VTLPFLQATFDYDVRSAADKIASMNDHGVDYAVLTLGINVSLPTVKHSQTAVTLGDAHNNWLVNEVLEKSDRLKGTLVVSHQNPQKFADQIDDYGSEDHVVGVQFPPSGPLPPLRLTEHPEYIGWTIQMIGADNVMFASDHPRSDFDAPADVVRQLRAALDDDRVRQIMGANARRVFGF